MENKHVQFNELESHFYKSEEIRRKYTEPGEYLFQQIEE